MILWRMNVIFYIFKEVQILKDNIKLNCKLTKYKSVTFTPISITKMSK